MVFMVSAINNKLQKDKNNSLISLLYPWFHCTFHPALPLLNPNTVKEFPFETFYLALLIILR